MKYTDIKLQTLQDKDLIFLIENNIGGGIPSVMGDRYVKSDDNKKIVFIDATNLYGHSMSKSLPYDEIDMWRGHSELYLNKLEEIVDTADDSDIGHFIEVDLKYPDNIKEKTKTFSFCLENKVISKGKYNDYMKKIQRIILYQRII